jgi:beta-xylosidase
MAKMMKTRSNSINFILHLGLLCYLCLPAQTSAGIGTYKNPIGGSITMGDPFILVDNDTYYLYGTTSVNDGFKVWSSTNLSDWESKGFAFKKGPDSWGENTFWAPEVFKYRGRFYMVYSAQPAEAKTFSARVCLAVSDHPEGPFEDLKAPLLDNGWSCIDGHVFVENDGTPWLYFARVGVEDLGNRKKLLGKIYGARLNEDLTALASEPVLCVQADQPWELVEEGRSWCTEGAYVFQAKGKYFMTYSANHYVEPIYGIGYANADSPLGPWIKASDNPLVSQNPAIGVSGPGHNCIITPPGSDHLYMVYHVHADPAKPSGSRLVYMDRLDVTDSGRLVLQGPTVTPQTMR